jgi:uncharacterized protein
MTRSSLSRIADALERLAPPLSHQHDFSQASAFIWEPSTENLRSVARINAVELDLLQGIGHVRDLLMENTLHFAKGYTANNVLLWGARGTGKSSLVKAVHNRLAAEYPLKIVEIHREDIPTLPRLMRIVEKAPLPIIVFCDDLSFDGQDSAYKALKSVLDGGLEGRSPNVVFYATSNRRHLMPRDMIENESSTAITPGEAVEEKVSLSDRFGLWLGFHNTSQNDYLAMVESYAEHYAIPLSKEQLRAEAIEWSVTRGARSGRVAWQLILHLAGEHGIKMDT